VPFDVPGLMSLYGSQDALLNKLDEFFNTPETAMDRGSY
jgi:putative alpha-1,2-mannosidase